MANLWRDACFEESLLDEIYDEPEPPENAELTVQLRSVFGKPFARGYDTDFTDTRILSTIFAGAAEVHVTNFHHVIGTLGSYTGAGASKLYGQIAALYLQHLNQGRKVRFTSQDESSYRVHLAILKLLNRRKFGSNLQFKSCRNHCGVDGKLHPVVYELTPTWVGSSLIKKETG